MPKASGRNYNMPDLVIPVGPLPTSNSTTQPVDLTIYNNTQHPLKLNVMLNSV